MFVDTGEYLERIYKEWSNQSLRRSMNAEMSKIINRKQSEVRESIPRGSVTMQVSLKPKTKLCSRIARIAAAVGFALVIGSFGVGSAYAGHGGGNHGGGNHGGGYHGGGGGYHGGGYHGGGGYYHGGGGYWGGGGGYWGGGPGYTNYYDAPSPYYYGSGPEYAYPPPQGVPLFFGL